MGALGRLRSGDVWGGLAGMLVSFPQAVAYGAGVLALLGPEYASAGALYGILGAVVLGIAASAVGGAGRLVSAPCGPAFVLLTTLADRLVRGDGGPPLSPERVLLLLTLVGILSAVLQIAYGAAGGGRLIKYIPYPVVSGYLSGVGLLLFAAYLPGFLGLATGPGVAGRLLTPSAWSLQALLVGAATAAAMVLAPRITRKVPGVFLGLGAGIAAFLLLAAGDPALRSLDGNLLVLGPVAGSVEDFAAGIGDRWRAAGSFGLPDLAPALAPALTLSLLLSIDTLKTCVVVDSLTRTRHDSNRTLVGQGVGNLLSALGGGMPGAGTMGGTLVNVHAGGTTRASGVLGGAFALLALLLLGPFLAWLPRAALAAVVLVVALRMLDLHSLDLLRHRATIPDFAVVAAVVGTAVTLGLVQASVVGLGLSILLFLREQVRGSVVRHRVPGTRVSSRRQRLPEQDAVLRARGGEWVVADLQGTLFFGTTDQLLTILEEDLRTRRFVVLDMRRVLAVDATAVHMLERIEAQLTERGAFLLFSSLPSSLPSGQDLRATFDRLGLVKKERNVLVFDEVDAAIEWVEDRVLQEAGHGEDLSAPPLGIADLGMFRDFEGESLRDLAAVLEERRAAPGEAIFRRGDPGDSLYFIRRGRVEIHIPLEGGRRHHLATFSRGAFFGDMAFLDRGIRSADAVAAKETDLYGLSRRAFDAHSRKHPDAGAMLFARLARILALRLRQTDAELQALEES
jgi:SulP family sulfate permease